MSTDPSGMKPYSVVYNPTGEIVLEVDDKQIQYANDLLAETKRLGLHTAAARHANSRDRAIKYGDVYRHPTGVVKSARVKRRTLGKRRRYKSQLQTNRRAAAELVSLMALGCVLFAVIAVLASHQPSYQ